MAEHRPDFIAQARRVLDAPLIHRAYRYQRITIDPNAIARALWPGMRYAPRRKAAAIELARACGWSWRTARKTPGLLGDALVRPGEWTPAELERGLILDPNNPTDLRI